MQTHLAHVRGLVLALHSETEGPEMPMRNTLLTPQQRAQRWSCSVKKLDADRLHATGCQYVKIGRLVRCRKSDIEAHEAAHVRRSTSNENRRRHPTDVVA